MTNPTTAATTPIADFLASHARQITDAATRIAPYTRRTPTLPTDLDSALLLKPESLQVTGSFKARGAFNAVIALKERTETQSEPPKPPPEGVIAVSSGNHAQALALAARTAGLKAVILIPEDANPAKVAATRALGAEVIQQGITFANREDRLRDHMQAHPGLVLIHPFDDWDIIHGQATAITELLEAHPQTKLIAAPVGGGGLLSGTALAAKAHNRDIRVMGVEPAAADDAYRTFKVGEIQTLPGPPTTIADGVRTTSIGRRNFEVMVQRRLVDEIVTVTEDEIATATITAWTRLKLAVEPTGALPLAAYLAGKLDTKQDSEDRQDNSRIQNRALILSGGNADQALIAKLLSR